MFSNMISFMHCTTTNSTLGSTHSNKQVHNPSVYIYLSP